MKAIITVLTTFLLANTSMVWGATELNDDFNSSVPEIRWCDLEKETLIGSGSCGNVYSGSWNGNEVAIKLLKIQDLSTEALRREFYEEVDKVWKYRSERLLKLYGVCVESGHISLILEKMQTSLYTKLRGEDDMTGLQQRQIATDICEGLVYLHERSIVHGNLKSSKVFLDDSGRAKIDCFSAEKLPINAPFEQRFSKIVDNIRWSAPEMLLSQPSTGKTDIFNYGMILWELLTQRTPFNQQEISEVFSAIINGYFEQIPNDAPQLLGDIIMACQSVAPPLRPEASVILNLLKTAS